MGLRGDAPARAAIPWAVAPGGDRKRDPRTAAQRRAWRPAGALVVSFALRAKVGGEIRFPERDGPPTLRAHGLRHGVTSRPISIGCPGFQGPHRPACSKSARGPAASTYQPVMTLPFRRSPFKIRAAPRAGSSLIRGTAVESADETIPAPAAAARSTKSVAWPRIRPASARRLRRIPRTQLGESGVVSALAHGRPRSRTLLRPTPSPERANRLRGDRVPTRGRGRIPLFLENLQSMR